MKAIQIVSVPVTDQQKSKEFYSKLGFELIVESPMGNGQTWLQMGIPNQTTSITLVNWFAEMQAGSMQGLVCGTDDIEKEVEELKGKGIEIAKIDPTPWGRFANIKDPDGNLLILHQE